MRGVVLQRKLLAPLLPPPLPRLQARHPLVVQGPDALRRLAGGDYDRGERPSGAEQAEREGGEAAGAGLALLVGTQCRPRPRAHRDPGADGVELGHLEPVDPTCVDLGVEQIALKAPQGCGADAETLGGLTTLHAGGSALHWRFGEFVGHGAMLRACRGAANAVPMQMAIEP